METLNLNPEFNKSTETPTSHDQTPFKDRSALTAAYDRRLPEIEQVPDDALITINVDFHAMVATVLGTLPELREMRGRIATLPELPEACIDSLKDYALAAGEANSRYTTAIAPTEDITALNEEAMRLREILRSDATALATRGLIDPAHLAPFKGLVGYKNVAFELIDWANLMRDCWPAIQGKTALRADELQHAKDVGERLMDAAGIREQGPTVVAKTVRIRQQAFTLLVNAYDQLRRAVTFLRWNEGDVDAITPSLYAGRGGRGRRADGEQQSPSAPPPATAPVVTPVTPAGAPSNGHVTPGLPSASPFVHL